jgi:hypothetical protein
MIFLDARSQMMVGGEEHFYPGLDCLHIDLLASNL